MSLNGSKKSITLTDRQWASLCCLLGVNDRRPITSQHETKQLHEVMQSIERQLDVEA